MAAMTDSFYVTTPIYYVNDRPHVGHAYSTIAADVLARFHRLRGRSSMLLTGTDEHGLKIERRARELNESPQAFVDRMAPPFEATVRAMSCEYQDFIRTTQPRHKKVVQALWDKIERNGDVYLDTYEGLYCVGCEAYYTERDLIDGSKCPVHRTPVEKVKEESYFFRLSRYGDSLLRHYEAQPDFVRPQGRFNEVVSFVEAGLRDLSISRTSFRWGVPVPGNPDHVMYVWLDALANYISALGGPGGELFAKYWASDGRVVHIVGKDILRFHAVYWPAFLMSAGISLPSQIWAHGWLTVDGEKMSKATGNFIPPEPVAEAVGVDALRYYLMRDVSFGQDGDFSHENLFARYHGDLGNGLGNLLNRIASGIVRKRFGGKIPSTAPNMDAVDEELVATAMRVSKDAAEAFESVAPHRALEACWELVSFANRYVDETAPWTLAKNGELERLGTVCYCVLEVLRVLSVLLWPVMPGKMDELRGQLGLAAVDPKENEDCWPTEWGGLQSGQPTRPGEPLFPRFSKDDESEVLASLRVGRRP